MKIIVKYHPSCKGAEELNVLHEISLIKPDIFRYGIFAFDVPSRVKEKDHVFMGEKVSAFEALYGDYIDFSNGLIVNLCEDDRQQKLVSEFIGIAVGIKFSIKNFKINQNALKKINKPKSGKYLDYAWNKKSREYQLETKGTISSSLSGFVKDILKKKIASNARDGDIHLRFGTIAKFCGIYKSCAPSILVVDDPPTGRQREEEPRELMEYYLQYLAYIYDNVYFNRLVDGGHIKKSVFSGVYKFKGDSYYGDFFDRRLVRTELGRRLKKGDNLEELLRELTERIGQEQYFIGIKEDVIDAMNRRDYSALGELKIEEFSKEKLGGFISLGGDGILMVKAVGGSDSQFSAQFGDEKVIARLGILRDIHLGTPHKCGAPCRSKEKEGKSCEIRTYFGSCHFHR